MALKEVTIHGVDVTVETDIAVRTKEVIESINGLPPDCYTNDFIESVRSLALGDEEEENKDKRCGFCGRIEEPGDLFIKGNNSRICEECAEICKEIIEERKS